MSKVKPLDLRDIEKKITEELAFEVDQVIDWRVEPKGVWDEDVIKDIVRRDVKIFSRVDYAVELQDVEELLQEIKHRIKSACEFFLRYRDKPELLIKEHPELKGEVEKRFLIEKEVSVICPNCKEENILILKGSMIRHEKEFPTYPKCIFEASLLGDKIVCYEDIHTIQCKFCGECLIPNFLISDLRGYNEWLFKLAFKYVFEEEK